MRDSRRFSRPRQLPSGFTLEHYAGPVTYRSDNLLDKNKEAVTREQQGECLRDSFLYM